MLRGSRLRRAIGLIAVLGVLVLALNACGSSSSPSGSAAASPSTSEISHTKTKFVLHAALAFGAFHHWIYKPAKAGDFKHPFSHKLTVLKAGLAAAFVYHEVKLALKDAQADPTLSKLVAPLTALQDKLRGLPAEVKGGNATPSSLGDVNDSIASVKQQAANAGQKINEQVPATPSG